MRRHECTTEEFLGYFSCTTCTAVDVAINGYQHRYLFHIGRWVSTMDLEHSWSLILITRFQVLSRLLQVVPRVLDQNGISLRFLFKPVPAHVGYMSKMGAEAGTRLLRALNL
jgi:hypothetical protein